MENFINKSETGLKNHEAAIKNLETQMGQMAKQMTERPPGMFPSDTAINPKENCSAITLRSGVTLNGSEQKKVENSNVNDEFVGDIDPLGENKIEAEKKKKDKNKTSTTIPTDRNCKAYFPKALVKKNLEKQFSKFLQVFKKLQINIPFSEIPLSEALEQMPAYAKFMKDIMYGRRKLSDVKETIMMTYECWAILQRKLPQKMKDPGSFTIPVEIEGLPVAKALYDLGASINLMPLTIFERLGLGEVTPTMINLQLADR
ncbi:uncharacterized protein LOC130744084 [Lotus japonicus]|uniref:uncharacterized protein LOC130744084 n=1 Tax=Lotus japonicus TaxID=34305 RepID=UPI00258A89AA|nr:uncharacterized protein LOC130744084 [Lotus japonicus]